MSFIRKRATQEIIISETGNPSSPTKETRAGGMLAAFASVGVERFDLTLTDAAGQKVAFRGNRTFPPLDIPSILQAAAEQHHNVIVRPRSSCLIQLDDLGEDMAERLRPFSFLTLRTSPGSYQAWIAVSDADSHFARRLKKGTGADLTASGASRLSGSFNFKKKYVPHFPLVETVHVNPGLIVSQADLAAFASPPEKTIPTPRIQRQPRGWPSYQRCLDGAPEKDGRRDRSRADYTFCLLAIDWGWSLEETAAHLMQVSAKAQENGEAYALRTARAAAAGIERRGGWRR